MPTIKVRDQILHPKPCKECGQHFQPNSSVHVFCGEECKGKHPYTTGRITTDGQYLRISNDWRKFLQRLTYGPARTNLTVDILLDVLVRQNYKCALSGQPLTCQLNRGMTHFTNASIDRIVPGSEYNADNIRLVCRIANVMKWNMADEQLREWCERIITFGKET